MYRRTVQFLIEIVQFYLSIIKPLIYRKHMVKITVDYNLPWLK